MRNQNQFSVVRKSNLAKIAKNLLEHIKGYDIRQKSRSFKTDTYDGDCLRAEYKFYCYLHNGNRDKALYYMEQYKKISNELLDIVMFDGKEIITMRSGPKGTIFNDNNENNLLIISNHMKNVYKDMEFTWNCKIINR